MKSTLRHAAGRWQWITLGLLGLMLAALPGGANGGADDPKPTVRSESLGLDMDSEHSGARLAVRLITGKTQSCGPFITPFTPGKSRPTPIKNDGTHYQWTLDYDPAGAGGRGQFKFTLRGDAPKPGEFTK